MIPRILVPTVLAPSPEGSGESRRKSTALDSRMLVPRELPAGPLQTESAIPSHVPLEVLGERMLVPRDLPPIRLEVPASPAHRFPPTTLDERIAVPPDAAPPVVLPKTATRMGRVSEVVDPDLFNTGEVHLITRPVEGRTIHWGWVSASSSVMVHVALIILFLSLPRIFPYQPPTEQEIELAHRNLGLVYVPPPPMNVTPLVPAPAVPPPSRIRIDPRVFKDVAPPDVEASPDPGGSAPRVAERQPSPEELAKKQPGGDERPESPRQMARIEPVPPPKAQPETGSGLRLDPRSPGRMLEDSLRGAIRGGPTTGSGEFGDPLPPNASGGAGGGRGFVGGTVQILTPTEGVDFTNYVARMLASVRRNWYAVIPESARLGERGVVVLDFAVQRDGSVPMSYPELMRTSGREPLDRAAISAIRASNPFEPLPQAFSGPEVRFRFIFLYNMRLENQ
jgi:TonB family protein